MSYNPLPPPLGTPYNKQVTGADSVKASAAGTLYGYHFVNTTAVEAFIQLFFLATSGAVTLGTTVPDLVIPLPANGGAVLYIPPGMSFANGLQIAATTTRTGATTNAVDAVVYYA